MIVVLQGGMLSLDEGDVFGRFSLLCLDAGHTQPGAGSYRIQFTGDGHAWVPISTIVTLQGEKATAIWRQQLDTMVEKARAYGWV